MGQLGVEIWANLKQPFIQGDSPQCFKRSDFVVVSRSARHLLVHVLNEHIDMWLLCAHAPTVEHHSQTENNGGSSFLNWFTRTSPI